MNTLVSKKVTTSSPFQTFLGRELTFTLHERNITFQKLTYVFNTDVPLEISNFDDRLLTISSYRLVEESLLEEWESEDDNFWLSFLKD
jgi:hypothetical protein